MKHTTPFTSLAPLVLAACALATLADQEKLPEGPGISKAHPNDKNIAKHPAVLFADDFEAGDLKKWEDMSGTLAISDENPHGGKHCAVAPMEKGKNTGGQGKKWFMPGADKVFARVYVKFSEDYQYPHHFIWLSANPRNNKWKSFGKAGLKPDGTYFSTGMECWFAWGKNPPPGELGFYSYYMDMEIDPKMNKYWGNGFFPPGPAKGKAAGERSRPPQTQPMAVLGVHAPVQHPRQSRRRAGHVARRKTDRPLHRHPLAQRPGSQDQLLLAGALRLRPRRSDQAISQAKANRLVRRRRDRQGIYRTH
jgi:hypothetical protein